MGWKIGTAKTKKGGKLGVRKVKRGILILKFVLELLVMMGQAAMGRSLKQQKKEGEGKGEGANSSSRILEKRVGIEASVATY